MVLPTFETSRLFVKEVTAEDIPSYSKHFVDYEVIRHLALPCWPYPENGVQAFLEQFIFPNQGQDRWMWGIYLKSAPDELIGSVDLWRQGKPEHRGFWLGRKYWGQGIMTEAVIPITDYAFNHLGFETLIFSNAKGNMKSRRIKEKTGARYLCDEPASIFVDPSYTEHEIWELTKEVWFNRSQ